MSVFKRGKYYYMDFVIEGQRVAKSTKETNKTFAIKKMEAEKKKIKKERDRPKKPPDKLLSEALEEVYENRWQHQADGLKAFKRVDTIVELTEDKNIYEINSTWIDSLRHTLRNSLNITEATINRYVASLRTVLKENNINIKYRIIKETPEKELVFTPEHEEEIINKLQNSTLKYSRELSFLFPILIDTGMRLSEALSITKENILDNYSYIELFSKNCKASNPRIIPLTDRVSELLKTVIEEEMFNGLTNYTFSKLFKKIETKEGYTLHTCRHTFASRLGQSSNCTALQLQYLLGHKSLKTTQRYTHFLHREQLKELF